MLKQDITYEDFNGEQATETLYFNLTKTEIIELEVSYKDGLEATLKRIIATQDNKQLVAEFKRIVLLAYGQKSEDGRRFIKSDELREEFSQTAAYDELFIKLSTDADFASEFIKGIIPKGIVTEVEKAEKAEVVHLPPTPPNRS